MERMHGKPSGSADAPRPSAARAALAALAAVAALAAGPARSSDLAALAREGDAEAGERVYASCAVCHRPDGGGRPDGTFPQLAGQHRSVIVKQLVDIRDGRRRNPVMEPFVHALVDDREIADVAAYVASLPLPADAGRGDGDDLERGSRLYARDCAGCHGERGEGAATAVVPVLAGGHYAYLLRQLRTIAAGRRANAHPAMPSRVSRYTDAELQAVVDYASRLPGPARGDER